MYMLLVLFLYKNIYKLGPPMTKKQVKESQSRACPPYIHGGESPKPMKFPMDSSFVTQSFSPIVISSLTRVYRPTKVEKLWMEAFRSLCSYSLPMDIVCLNTTSVWTYQMS